MGDRAKFLPDQKVEYEEKFGVAFSGGGVRSASLCSGVLQQLVEYSLLGEMDMPKIFSCVSGGGYIGAGFTNFVAVSTPQTSEDFQFYFDSIREKVGYYIDCESLWLLPDLLVMVLFLLALLVVSCLVLFPTTFVVVEVLLFGQGVWEPLWDSPFWIVVWVVVAPVFTGATVFAWWADRRATQASFTGMSYLVNYLFLVLLLSLVLDYRDPLTYNDGKAFLAVLLCLRHPGLVAVIVQSQMVRYWSVLYWCGYYQVYRDNTPDNFDECPSTQDDYVKHEAWQIYAKIGLCLIGFLSYWRDRLVFRFSKWRLERCYFPEKEPWWSCRLRKIKSMSQMKDSEGPLYIGQCTVNLWELSPRDENYTPGYTKSKCAVLAMTPTGWERYENGLRKPVIIHPCECKTVCCTCKDTEGSEELHGAPDVLLSSIMAMSAAAGSFFNGNFGAVNAQDMKAQALFGMHMGRWLRTTKRIPCICHKCQIPCYGWIWDLLICVVVNFLLAVPYIFWDVPDDADASGLVALVFYLGYVALWTVFPHARCPLEKQPTTGNTNQKNDTEKTSQQDLCRCSCGAVARSIYSRLPHLSTLRTLTASVDTFSRLPAVIYVSDGGHTENMGFLPLVHRRMKTIIVVNGGDDRTNADFKDAVHQAHLKLAAEFETLGNLSHLSVMEAIDKVTSHPKEHVLCFKVVYASWDRDTWWHSATPDPHDPPDSTSSTQPEADSTSDSSGNAQPPAPTSHTTVQLTSAPQTDRKLEVAQVEVTKLEVAQVEVTQQPDDHAQPTTSSQIDRKLEDVQGAEVAQQPSDCVQPSAPSQTDHKEDTQVAAVTQQPPYRAQPTTSPQGDVQVVTQQPYTARAVPAKPPDLKPGRSVENKDLPPQQQEAKCGYIYFVMPKKEHYDHLSLEPLKPTDTCSRDQGKLSIVPPKTELAGCCCRCCHRLSCWSKCSGSFPFHHTASQFFTRDQFDSYHHQGIVAMRKVHKLMKEHEAGFTETTETSA